MSAKWQTFKVQIPKGYSPTERKSIAQDIIDFIVDRTQQGKDKNNRSFTPGYSKGYAKSRVGQLAGKRKGATPNLTLSGEMLEALGDYLIDKPDELTIGFEKGTPENARADGNVRGTYGKRTPNKRLERDFMGITEKDLGNILADYPIKDPVTRFKSTVINAETKSAAEDLARKFSQEHDLSIEDLLKVVRERFS